MNRSWLVILPLFALLAVGESRAEWLSDAQDIMGTRVSVELWSDDAVAGGQAIAAVMTEMRRIEQLLSSYLETSELSRLNSSAARRAVPVGDELYQLLNKSLYYSRLSDGAFDISYASVGRQYGYRESRQPDAQQLLELLPAIDYRSIRIDHAARTVRFTHPELKISLGGIAKGYAVDKGIELLRARGIVSAIVSAGGDSRILGDRGDRPWVMGIRHPRNDGEYAVKIPLQNTALSTSGDYGRVFISGEGERVHHILNPDTGRSATGVQSVSILAPLAIDSDALSTTVFVLGVERGLELVNRVDGVDAIIIDGAGKLHYSAELLMPVQR